MMHQLHIRTITTLAALTVLLPLFAQTLSAQNENRSRTRFGLYGGGLLTSHLGDFPYLPGTTGCCLRFSRGSGFGLAAGGLVEYPLGSLLLGTRMGYSRWPFEFTTDEGTYLIIDGTGAEGTFQHRLLGSYATLDVIPTIAFRYTGGLHLMAGIRVGVPLSSSYDQYEQIIRPEAQGTFLNADGTDSHSRVRNRYSGSIPDISLQLAPLGGLFWELPMNQPETLLLVSEAYWQFGLTDVAAGVDWKASGLYLGLSLKYQMGSGEIVEGADTEDVLVSVDTLHSGASDVTEVVGSGNSATTTMKISAVAIGPDGREEPVARIVVEEFSSTLMTPLLPYIFFDENSSTIPERYHAISPGEADRFRVDTLKPDDLLATYYNLLNIVGARLREHPSATITLTGTNQDHGSEAGDTSLSRGRAESVRAWLTDRWNISPARITLSARNLPEKAAGSTTTDGSAENRRVEIASSDPHILRPIVSRDTLRRVNPPVILLRPGILTDVAPDRWRITATQGESVLRTFEGEGMPPATIEWNFARGSSTIPRSGEDLLYRLEVEGPAGDTATGRIDVDQVTIRQKRLERRGDVEIDRFSLILFDVRSSELSALHDSVIGLIRQYIRPNSVVRVTGYTDRLGESDYNQRLAEARAASVAAALRREGIEATGIGEADLYSSPLPEARLYTRIVEVVIETPTAP